MIAETYKVNETIRKKVSNEIEFELNSFKEILIKNIKNARNKIHALYENSKISQKQLIEQTNYIEKIFTENLNFVPSNEKSKVLTCFQMITETYRNRKIKDDYELLEYHNNFIKDLILFKLK